MEINKLTPTVESSLPTLKATGVLLAGGKSSRMKKNKAFLEINGKGLAERTLEVLQSVFSEVIISTNTPEYFTQFGLPIVQDEVLGRGPLEGIFQGLKRAAYESVFFVACDMPFLRGDLIRQLEPWIWNYDIVVPKLKTGLHPLHAFYHRRCLPTIENHLKDGRLKIRELYSVCSVKYVGEGELGEFPNLTEVFCNLNTPEDLEACFGLGSGGDYKVTRSGQV